MAENTKSYPGLGLTVDWFLQSLPEPKLRAILDSDILQLLDALFGGAIEGKNLRRVAINLIEFDSILEQLDGKKFVLNHLPQQKLKELGSRVGLANISKDDFLKISTSSFRAFFGLLEERPIPRVDPTQEQLSPRYGLFQHQRAAVQELSSLLNSGERKAVLHFPTGVGKTRTAMHVVASTLRSHEPSVVVWLASGRELLQQAVGSFKAAWESLGNRQLQIGSMWGDKTPDLDEFSDGFLAVSLSKGWSLSRTDPDWTLRLASKVRLVVFDEAHQSIAKTYRRITEELTVRYECALLGLTATPGRTWTDIDQDGKLAEFFAENKVTINVPSENPIEYLTKNSYLARPTFRTLFF